MLQFLVIPLSFDIDLHNKRIIPTYSKQSPHLRWLQKSGSISLHCINHLDFCQPNPAWITDLQDLTGIQTYEAIINIYIYITDYQ